MGRPPSRPLRSLTPVLGGTLVLLAGALLGPSLAAQGIAAGTGAGSGSATAADGSGSAAAGSGSTAAGSGSTAAGSGSTAAGSGSTPAGNGSGSAPAGTSGSAAAGSGSGSASAGSGSGSAGSGGGSAGSGGGTASGSGSAEAPAAPPAPPAPSSGKSSSGKGKTSKDSKGKSTTPPAKPAPPPPKPPVPNKMLADLKWFDGDWNCTGKVYGPGPEHPTTATMSFTWQLDGFWLQSSYTEARSTANPVPYDSISQWGWDPVATAIACVLVDNQEGSVAESTPGWNSERLVFEGSGHRYGVQFEGRDSYTRRSASRFLHVFQIDVNGNWVKLREEICNRIIK